MYMSCKSRVIMQEVNIAASFLVASFPTQFDHYLIMNNLM